MRTELRVLAAGVTDLWELTKAVTANQFILKIPRGPVLVYLHQLQVTPMARHTPYLP